MVFLQDLYVLVQIRLGVVTSILVHSQVWGDLLIQLPTWVDSFILLPGDHVVLIILRKLPRQLILYFFKFRCTFFEDRHVFGVPRKLLPRAFLIILLDHHTLKVFPDIPLIQIASLYWSDGRYFLKNRRFFDCSARPKLSLCSPSSLGYISISDLMDFGSLLNHDSYFP